MFNNLKTFIIGGILLAVVGFVIVFALMMVSYHNKEVDLKTQYSAEVTNSKIVFDKTWKTIAKLAQVSDSYKESFEKIYVGIAVANNPDGQAQMMKWTQQSNPQFDISLMTKLMNAIEATSSEFAESQKKLADVNREHEALINKFPGNIFLWNAKSFEDFTVTSTRTTNAFTTKVDDDVDLYHKK